MAADRPGRFGWVPRPRSKCGAGKFAGSITGLLAGIAVVIPLANAVDLDWVEYVLGGLIIILAALGGMFTGAIASGCYGQESSHEREGSSRYEASGSPRAKRK